MIFSTRLERLVQSIGSEVSYRIFTDETLTRPWGQRSYLWLYQLFKRTFGSSELEALSRFISPGSTVIDVGANVGFMSVFFSEKVGPEGVVLAIEPDPVNRKLLARNLAVNGCDNVRILPFALGDYDGQTTLHRNLVNRADSRVVFDRDSLVHSRKIDVEIRTLSSLVAGESEVPEVSLVKVDSQGYEVPILRGTKDWLASLASKPVLSLECWPWGLRASGYTIEDLFVLLAEYGFEVSPELYDRLLRNTGMGDYENVVFVPAAEGDLVTESSDARA